MFTVSGVTCTFCLYQIAAVVDDCVKCLKCSAHMYIDAKLLEQLLNQYCNYTVVAHVSATCALMLCSTAGTRACPAEQLQSNSAPDRQCAFILKVHKSCIPWYRPCPAESDTVSNKFPGQFGCKTIDSNQLS